MSLSEILEYKLISVGEYGLTVFNLVLILAIVASVIFFLFFLRAFLRRQERRGKIDIGQNYAIYKLTKYILWIFAIVLILQSVGVDLTIFVAGSAALLVGLGLGINQIFSDVISGFMVLIEGIIKVGEVVEVDNIIAQVEKIRLRTTIVRGRDNIAIIIPNSKFVNDNVINWSHIKEETRFSLNVGVAYDSDIPTVKKIMMDAALNNPHIHAKKPPQVRLLDYGDNALIMQLHFWAQNEFRVESIKSEIRYEILENFRKHGVEIPFPQRDVHIKSSKVSFK
jgi:small-conductance mechanosensitive channel